MLVQRLDARGEWTPAVEFDLSVCVGRRYETRSGWKEVESVEHAESLLARGFELRTGSDWYDHIRAPKATPAVPQRTPTVYANDRPEVKGYEGEE